MLFKQSLWEGGAKMEKQEVRKVTSLHGHKKIMNT